MIPVAALVIALLLMLAELYVSRRNEQALRGLGAVAPPDPAYSLMRWAYPGTFVAMALEGLLAQPATSTWVLNGLVIFAAGKALKAWAISSLGVRWTYRIFVLPGQPLVAHGPYRWIRHPNYVGVVAELVGFGMVVDARWTAIAAVVGFGELLRRRIRAEEEALGLN